MRKRSELYINCCIAGYVFLLMLLCVNSSPIINRIGTDSSVFASIGRAMLKGKIMYKELFDHKGLYIYFLNCIAAFISPHSFTGIFIIETVFMFACARIVYAVFMMYAGQKASFLGMQIFMCIVLNYKIIQGGNLTEEYALLFQLCSVYLAVKYLKSGMKEHPAAYMFFHGICASAALFLRPNMIMMWGAFALTIGAELLMRRNMRGFFRNLAAGLGGMMAGAAPVIAYVYLNDAVHDAVFDLFAYNFIYTSSGAGMYEVIKRIMHTMMSMDLLLAFIFASSIVISMTRGKLHYYAALALSILSISLSGRQYGHYYLYIVPFCLPFVCELAVRAAAYFPERSYKFIVYAVFALNIYIGYSAWSTAGVFFKEKILGREPENAEFIRCNKPYHSENEKVLITGNRAAFYSILDTIPREKYFYVPATNYKFFPDAADAQAASIISGTNDVIITHAEKDILPETGRSREIRQVLDTEYVLLILDEKNNAAMYGRKQ